MNTAIDPTKVFGLRRDYKKGEVIVWKGFRPAIMRLERDFKFPENPGFNRESCIYANREADSLHYSHVRLATPEEIKRLEAKEGLLLFLDVEDVSKKEPSETGD